MPMTAEQKRAKRAADRAQREAQAAADKAAGQPTAVEKLNAAATVRPDLIGSQNVATRSGSGETVTVGLKLGVAYFDIQLCEITEKFEQNMQGGRTIKEAVRIGKKVRLRGTSYPRGQPPEGFPERPLIIGGAAMNPGIDKEFWDKWVEQNKLNPMVVNGMIFANTSADYVAFQAKEMAAVQSGLEPIDPLKKNDPRIPKSTRVEMTNIETEEGRAQKQARFSGAAQ